MVESNKQSSLPHENTQPVATKENRDLQTKLNTVAKCSIVVDGIYGQKTKECVATFQQACMKIGRVENLGNAGENTRKELAYHANIGNTIRNCKTSTISASNSQKNSSATTPMPQVPSIGPVSGTVWL